MCPPYLLQKTWQGFWTVAVIVKSLFQSELSLRFRSRQLKNAFGHHYNLDFKKISCRGWYAFFITQLKHGVCQKMENKKMLLESVGCGKVRFRAGVIFS